MYRFHYLRAGFLPAVFGKNIIQVSCSLSEESYLKLSSLALLSVLPQSTAMNFDRTFQIFTPAEIASLRIAGSILRDCLKEVSALVVPGISTLELDREVEKYILSRGGRPAFKGYFGFTGSLCTSVNEEVVHGLPRADKVLTAGDIISLDCGVIYEDLYTDACVTVPVGTVAPATRKFLSHVSQTLEDVIAEIVKAGVHVGDISSFIEKRLQKGGYQAVRTLTGHGLGTTLHQFPDVPNVGKAGTGPLLPVGTMIAIEPIATMGAAEVFTADDGWTVITVDNSLAAHFEHSVLITEAGPEVIA